MNKDKSGELTVSREELDQEIIHLRIEINQYIEQQESLSYEHYS